jgi:hypothetical protein
MYYYKTNDQRNMSSEYIVAYMDFMGTENRIQYTEKLQKYSMNSLHNIYFDYLNKIAVNTDWSFNNLIIKIFSDNVIIANKLDKENTLRVKEIDTLLNATAIFHNMSICNDIPWLLRGGITIGELFIDEIMVWGNALVKAYHIENKIAKYPRIVIDEDVTEIMENKKISDIINKDIDGQHYLNSLKCNGNDDIATLNNGFSLLKTELNLNYSEEVHKYLNWHKNYINKEFINRKESNKSNLLSLD